MQKAAGHNAALLKSLVWGSAWGGRTPRFAHPVNANDEGRAKKMLDVILSNTALKQIARHERLLAPTTEYTRKQDMGGVQTHQSAIRRALAGRMSRV
eukprot:2692707-Alexandrium_andersonii.AAC.1